MQGTIWGDDALDSLEAAQYLGCARSTLWQKYREWGLPNYRVGGTMVFLKSDIEKWVAERKRKQEAQAAGRWAA